MGRYVVVVSHGTVINVCYACVPSLDSAHKLQEVARERGYANPQVLTEVDFNRIRNKRVDISEYAV